MPEDNHNGNRIEIVNSTSACSSMGIIEFNWPLFVYQRRARGGGEFLFTIAVWRGPKLLPICHLQPFHSALAALGQALIAAGQSQSASIVSAGSDSHGCHREARTDTESPSAVDNSGKR